MHKYTCPNCGKHLSYTINQLGKRIKCPKCQQSLQVGLGTTPEKEGASGGSMMSALQGRLWLLIPFLAIVAGTVFVWRRYFVH
jgi:hypothetical protein